MKRISVVVFLAALTNKCFCNINADAVNPRAQLYSYNNNGENGYVKNYAGGSQIIEENHSSGGRGGGLLGDILNNGDDLGFNGGDSRNHGHFGIADSDHAHFAPPPFGNSNYGGGSNVNLGLPNIGSIIHERDPREGGPLIGLPNIGLANQGNLDLGLPRNIGFDLPNLGNTFNTRQSNRRQQDYDVPRFHNNHYGDFDGASQYDRPRGGLNLGIPNIINEHHRNLNLGLPFVGNGNTNFNQNYQQQGNVHLGRQRDHLNFGLPNDENLISGQSLRDRNRRFAFRNAGNYNPLPDHIGLNNLISTNPFHTRHGNINVELPKIGTIRVPSNYNTGRDDVVELPDIGNIAPHNNPADEGKDFNSWHYAVNNGPGFNPDPRPFIPRPGPHLYQHYRRHRHYPRHPVFFERHEPTIIHRHIPAEDIIVKHHLHSGNSGRPFFPNAVSDIPDINRHLVNNIEGNRIDHTESYASASASASAKTSRIDDSEIHRIGLGNIESANVRPILRSAILTPDTVRIENVRPLIHSPPVVIEHIGGAQHIVPIVPESEALLRRPVTIGVVPIVEHSTATAQASAAANSDITHTVTIANANSDIGAGRHQIITVEHPTVIIPGNIHQHSVIERTNADGTAHSVTTTNVVANVNNGVQDLLQGTLNSNAINSVNAVATAVANGGVGNVVADATGLANSASDALTDVANSSGVHITEASSSAASSASSSSSALVENTGKEIVSESASASAAAASSVHVIEKGILDSSNNILSAI